MRYHTYSDHKLCEIVTTRRGWTAGDHWFKKASKIRKMIKKRLHHQNRTGAWALYARLDARFKSALDRAQAGRHT